MGRLAVMAAILLAPAPAWALLEPSTAGRAALARFNSLDGNGDRVLDKRELVARGAAADALFMLLDADGDGRLSLKEVEGAGGGARVARFDAYDRDRDGFVGRGEFPRGPDPRLLAALDRNGDGGLALSELRPAFAGMEARRRAPPAVPVKRQVSTADAAPLCWVPAFGGRRPQGWGLEAPVAAGGRGCRTSPPTR